MRYQPAPRSLFLALAALCLASGLGAEGLGPQATALRAAVPGQLLMGTGGVPVLLVHGRHPARGRRPAGRPDVGMTAVSATVSPAGLAERTAEAMAVSGAPAWR